MRRVPGLCATQCKAASACCSGDSSRWQHQSHSFGLGADASMPSKMLPEIWNTLRLERFQIWHSRGNARKVHKSTLPNLATPYLRNWQAIRLLRVQHFLGFTSAGPRFLTRNGTNTRREGQRWSRSCMRLAASVNGLFLLQGVFPDGK